MTDISNPQAGEVTAVSFEKYIEELEKQRQEAIKNMQLVNMNINNLTGCKDERIDNNTKMAIYMIARKAAEDVRDGR
jgi:esterase/lipase